ncbi:PIG-L deacetylase family protein (plasmid) [Novosphingobium sp. BL-8H]|uniref:PIG-L deacetylase family protein n=1 Tax=Novosphingobium sp. BL-8H TaxID=3127640 RepID=UPI003756A50E
MSIKPKLLFVGSHPDDLELGAGGLIKAAFAGNYSVGVVILTDVDDLAEANRRREEAISGLCHLGANPESIAFAAFRDGYLECNRRSVDLIRKTAHSVIDNPSVVITHTHADAHLDHIRAAELTIASFRKAAFLGFAIPNSLIISKYKPSLCVDVSISEDCKIESTMFHKSQVKIGRIDSNNIVRLHRAFTEVFNIKACETFDQTHLFENEESYNSIDYLVKDGVLNRSIDGIQDGRIF